MRPICLTFLAAALALTATPSDARKRHARHVPPPARASAGEAVPAPDDLYRRRGYGQGGLVYGGGTGGISGGTAMAGACADLAFARPLPCEPGGGYGLYGNGLGYPFGF